MRISDWSSDVCSSDLRRLIQSLFVLLAVSVVVFFAVYAVGDPIELLVSPEATMEARAATIARLGLDLPIWQQYFTFLWHALHGDLGNSFVHGDRKSTRLNSSH